MTEPIYEDIPGSTVRSVVSQFGVRISPTEAIRGLKEGQSFLVDNDRSRRIVTSAAYRLGINIRTEKAENGRYRISLK